MIRYTQDLNLHDVSNEQISESQDSLLRLQDKYGKILFVSGNVLKMFTIINPVFYFVG